MNASNFTILAVLSQRNKENKLYPVTFFLKKHSLQELSFQVLAKELYATMYLLIK